MGWLARLFGGESKSPTPRRSHVDEVLRRASLPGADRPCVATLEDDRIIGLYLEDAEQLDGDEWTEILAHTTVRDSVRTLDLVLLHDVLKRALHNVELPALRRLVVGSFDYDDSGYRLGNIGWGAQGELPSIAALAPSVEELVLRGVEGFGPLPQSVRSLTWVSLASSHPDALDLGEEGALAQLTELVLIEVPNAPFATRRDLTALRRLVVTPSGLRHWMDRPFADAVSVEVLAPFGLDQSTIDELVALRARTGAQVSVVAEPEGIEIDDERGVSVRIDLCDHPLWRELEVPG